MGMGAGAAYLMGLTHLHEHVDDELRGRVFAALFGLMRIGLFVAMALAVPLDDAFRWVNFWRLDNSTRVVLALGGVTIFLSGVFVIISLRSSFIDRSSAGRRRTSSPLPTGLVALIWSDGMPKPIRTEGGEVDE